MLTKEEIIECLGDRVSDSDLEDVDLDEVVEIVNAKEEIGEDAWLWAHTSGDVILWPSEESSINDDGANAVKRWQVNNATVAALYFWIDDLV
jgi:hypothetical protein